MNTHNVKTATKESSERWGSDPKARLTCVIAEQKSYLTELCGLVDLHLSQKDEADQVLGLLSLMTDNVLKEGVLCWYRSYLLTLAEEERAQEAQDVLMSELAANEY